MTSSARRRAAAAETREARLDGLDHRDRVRARLPAHLEDDGGHAVEARQRALLGVPSSARPTSRTRIGRRRRGDDEIVEGRGSRPARACGATLRVAGGDVAARHVGVLADERVADGGDGSW
jgi:hypothetical protein